MPVFLLQNLFRTEKITGMHLVIIDEKDAEHELAMKSGQPNLAPLLVYISFLYIDGCQLLIMDKEFEVSLDDKPYSSATWSHS